MGIAQSADLAQMDQNTGGPILPVHSSRVGTPSQHAQHVEGYANGTASPELSTGNAAAGAGGRSNPSSSNWSRAPGYSHIHTGASLGRHGYGSFGQRLGHGHPTLASGAKKGEHGEGASAEEAGSAQGETAGGFMAQLLRRVSGDKGRTGHEADGGQQEHAAGASGYSRLSVAQPAPAPALAPMEAGRAGGDVLGNARAPAQAGESTWSAWGSRRGSINEE